MKVKITQAQDFLTYKLGRRRRSNTSKAKLARRLKRIASYKASTAVATVRGQWTIDEETTLEKFFLDFTYPEFAELLGRSLKSIERKAHRLGLGKLTTLPPDFYK